MDRRRITACKAVVWIGCALLLPITQAWVQLVRSARGVQKRPYIAPPQQPFNSMVRDRTPFNCEQYRNHPHPGMQHYCQSLKA